MTRSADESLAEWSLRHGGYDVSRSQFVRGWLRFVHLLAAPLARISPDVLSAAGVVSAAAAVVVPDRRGAGLVVATGVLDGVDGAVARLRGTSTRHGALVDTTADRITDVLFLLALARAGARRSFVVAAGAGTAVLEARRALSRRRGDPVTVVTPGERPFRVAYTALGLATSPSLAAAVVAGTTLAGARALYGEAQKQMS
ncbi:MAG: CDP-alcohol phosphatidyltransferase family protein [Frankiaceae bacterium]|nr:CDP-alcohol phosphatidyltransferase family protein [Frankiaceae bacterium]